jgi:hypothetical protein
MRTHARCRDGEIRESRDFQRAVTAAAVLAGVIGKLIMFPSGALMTIPVGVRIAAAGLGLVAFFAVRRSVFVGVAVGETALIAGAIIFGL